MKLKAKIGRPKGSVKVRYYRAAEVTDVADPKPDFNKLARNSAAWNRHASQVIHQLSQRKEAVIKPEEPAL